MRNAVYTIVFFCCILSLHAHGVQQIDSNRAIKDAIDKLNDKGKTLWSSNPDSLIIVAYEAISWSKKIGYAKGEVEGLKNLGAAYYEKGEYTRSITEYQRAILWCEEKLTDPAIQSTLHSNISLPLIMINVHKEALEHLYKALAIAEEHDLASTKAHVVHNIGMLHNYQNNDKEALANYRESQSLYEALGDTSKSTFILGNIAHILLRAKDYAGAEQHYEQSLKLAKKYDNQKAMINALSSMGTLNIQKKQHEVALTYLLAAKELSEATQERTEYLRVLQNLSDCYKALGNEQKAIEYAKACLDLATEQAQLYYIQQASFMLGELHDLTGNFATASAYYKKSKLLTDSLATVNSQNETVRLEEKFKYEKQSEQLIADYDQQLKQRKTVVFASIGLVLILLLAIMLMNRIIKQKKRNLQLIKESRLLAESRNKELHKMNLFKSHIISILGHDIKPPVENLKLMLHLIENDSMDKEDRQRIAILYNEQLESTIRFLNNLLLWAIAQSEQKRAQKKWVNLYDTFKEVQHIYRSQLSHKHISLDIKVDERLEVFVDEEMLKVVLRNLTHNALKFCNANDKILLHAVFDDENATATALVEDSGMGISKNVQDTLFEMGDMTTAGTGDERGTALGLMLCKQYLQLNESTLNLDTAEGRGSTFWFTLSAKINRPYSAIKNVSRKGKDSTFI